MESLEERVFMFMDEQYYFSNSNESELHMHHHPSVSVENISWENNTDFDDSPERTLYWKSQIALLQEILERYHLSGSKLRREVGRIIKEVKASDFCSCLKANSWDCTTCLRRRVVDGLCRTGFSTNLCISKWETTKKFPGGCHEYIEVIANTSTMKKIHFLVELELKEQFQIAKASENYQNLESCLPEFYIGKPEYLTAIVRVMCNAAKKSMKEKKMHVGPWRKSSFMQMKWSGFNQICNSNKSLGSVTTYSHAQTNQSYLRISGAPTPVLVT
ncbi:hypothetical protein GLYMA_01G231800v4 [Glycine max]|uniref:DUF506 family protein n=1 Tax=Glycine max TaxID=3847 RepID=I1JAL0_SOYBN|nr:uncharacterized protein LOC100791546 [Glycine max]KAG5070337.1 hypothetical protein JHK85_002714 [Glycine max]KAH1164334.1 hypothetical protein GYH30_002399 [Glycine max]KAH1267713.1 hypothetical protein GmHk_01G002871 [Glycine max]KRH77753.1 hypothetical protein GLYMA_01G231800v4 [Glycine max]|eukprot:XP_003517546.1 uncharacterized protein LOC100791546 [Glycine max]